MTTAEIRKLAMESAKNYYKYLEAEGKGIEVISVKNIKHSYDRVYAFRLSRKVYDLDYTALALYDEECDGGDYKLFEYDYDANLLYAHLSERLENKVLTAGVDNVTVLSDLKFLVKRVYDWYDRNGMKVQLRQRVSDVVPDIKDDCSEDQEAAIKNIFSSPLSYIWGPPGTGKTKYVLSNAVLNYDRRRRRIMITAPTNNSLEQTLYGVLDVFKKNNIPCEKVLRLGVPSNKFAALYPQCCEVRGIQKKLQNLKSRIEICKRKINFIIDNKAFFSLEYDIKPKIQRLIEMENDKKSLLNELSTLEDHIESLRGSYEDIREMIKTLNTRLLSVERKRTKYSKTLLRVIAARKQKDLALETQMFADMIAVKERELTEQENNYNKARDKREELKTAISGIECEADKLKDFIIKNNVSNLIGKNDLVNSDTINMLLPKINRHLDKYRRNGIEGKAGKDDLKKYKALLEELEEKYKHIQAQSFGGRLGKVTVLAATIDRFISTIECDSDYSCKYDGVPFGIAHLFLDEAGYCGLIKAMTVLSVRCPITMLGDHMQLPPVCEMSDEKIEKEKNIFIWAQSGIAMDTVMENDFMTAYGMYNRNENIPFINISKSDLTRTYRFGRTLSGVLDAMVYKNGFGSADQAVDSEIKVIPVIKSPGKKKRENPSEADAIVKYIHDAAPSDAAVLTPYKDQVDLIGACLPRLKDQQRVMTVHASQGREWDTVIFSAVDTTDKWFTDSNKKESKGLRLLNTAVSRARKKLIIVCDAEYWMNESGQLLTELIKVSG